MKIKKRRHHPEAFKQMIVRRAAESSVPVIAEQFDLAPSMIYTWREQYPPGPAENEAPHIQPAHGPMVNVGEAVTKAHTKGMIIWDDEEITKVAAEWVLLRAADPYHDSSTALLEKAQRKVLPGERQRDCPSLNSQTRVCQAITEQWKAFLDKPAPAPEPVAPPPPQIITVEVPRRLTGDEMLHSVDECTLEALLAAKRIARQVEHNHLLAQLAAAATGKPVTVGPAFKPTFDMFSEPTRRVRRIAVVGLPVMEEQILLAEIHPLNLNVKLCFPEVKNNLLTSDYAIICRQGDQNGSDPSGDRAIGQLGRNRVALLDEPSHAHIVQKVRDFLTQI